MINIDVFINKTVYQNTKVILVPHEKYKFIETHKILTKIFYLTIIFRQLVTIKLDALIKSV